MNKKQLTSIFLSFVVVTAVVGLFFVSEFTGEISTPIYKRCCIHKENGLYSILGSGKQCKHFEIDNGLMLSQDCAKKSSEYKKKLKVSEPTRKPIQTQPTPVKPPTQIPTLKPKCIPECFSNNCGGENDGCGGKCKIRSSGEPCSGGFCDGKGVCRKSTCQDTDGGDNPSVAGEVSGFDEFDKKFTFKDFCKDILVFNKPEKAVQEYYCAPELAGSSYGSTYVSSTRTCGAGKSCKDGGCVKK